MHRLSTCLLLGVFLAFTAHGQEGGAPEVSIKSLQAITQRDPKNAAAWRALGTAYTRLHNYDAAIAAYRHALAVEPDSPQTFFNIGKAYAANKDAEHAFEWLGRARATHRYDMTQITDDPILVALSGDPRFATLLPKPAEFERPFVEPVKIIREWRGEAPNDQFGWIARNIGDVDGDRVNDFVTSAPTHGAADSHAGRIYVYSTRSGQLLWSADGHAKDELGTGTEAAGDANHDGIPDVIASGPAGSGVAFIYSGRDGHVLRDFKSNNKDEAFGNHVSGAGDLDRDGYADVIIGAPGREGEFKVPGHAYVYSGKNGELLLTLSGERPGDAFGSTVGGQSRQTGQFLIVGAPGGGEQHHGRVYVYSGLSKQPKFTIESDATGNALGRMFVSAPGDMDGDAVTEIYASDWSNTALGPSTGRVYVHSGQTGRRLFSLTGQTAGEGFGTSPSAAGDVDGDGRADLIVGAWQYAKAAVSGGRAYLYSGKGASLLKTYTSRIPGDTLGFDAVGMDDVDGDGTMDCLLTSAWSGVKGFHSGRVFVISSGVTRRSLKH